MTEEQFFLFLKERSWQSKKNEADKAPTRLNEWDILDEKGEYLGAVRFDYDFLILADIARESKEKRDKLFEAIEAFQRTRQ